MSNMPPPLYFPVNHITTWTSYWVFCFISVAKIFFLLSLGLNVKHPHPEMVSWYTWMQSGKGRCPWTSSCCLHLVLPHPHPTSHPLCSETKTAFRNERWGGLLTVGSGYLLEHWNNKIWQKPGNRSLSVFLSTLFACSKIAAVKSIISQKRENTFIKDYIHW